MICYYFLNEQKLIRWLENSFCLEWTKITKANFAKWYYCDQHCTFFILTINKIHHYWPIIVGYKFLYTLLVDRNSLTVHSNFCRDFQIILIVKIMISEPLHTRRGKSQLLSNKGCKEGVHLYLSKWSDLILSVWHRVWLCIGLEVKECFTVNFLLSFIEHSYQTPNHGITYGIVTINFMDLMINFTWSNFCGI